MKDEGSYGESRTMIKQMLVDSLLLCHIRTKVVLTIAFKIFGTSPTAHSVDGLSWPIDTMCKISIILKSE